MPSLHPPIWQTPGQLQHWLPHLWLPLLVFIGLWLLIKTPVRTEISQRIVYVELLHKTPTSDNEVTLKKPSQAQQPPKPTNVIDITAVIKPKPESVVTQKVATSSPKNSALKDKKITTKPSKPTVTVAELLKQSQTLPDLSVTDEFKARGDNSFRMPEIKVHNAYADIPYLPTNEDPYAMDLEFYAIGVEGNIDRFFDNVIPQKTFTTKYGTKINCVWAVILICSWK